MPAQDQAVRARSGIAREFILAGVIVAGALLVRLLGAPRGLPYLHEWDEPFVMTPTVQMFIRGSLNPHWFTWGSLYYYLLLPIVYLHYAYLHARGLIAAPGDIRLMHPQAAQYWWFINYPSFYLWGRVLTVCFGTATVYLTYRLGKAAFGTAAGLLAAAVLAAAPGAVYYADTVRVDVPMAFFATAALLAGLAVLERGNLRDYVIAGLLAGLATSTKQTAALLAVPLGIAHFLNPRRERLVDRNLGVMVLCMGAGFLAGTPDALLEPTAVFGSYRQTAESYRVIPSLGAIVSQLPRALGYVVRPSQGGETYPVPHAALGLIPGCAAAWGLVAGLLWRPRIQVYLAGFVLPALLFISGVGVFYLRNMMPVLPVASLWAGAGCVWLWRRVEGSGVVRRTAWRAGLGALGVALLLLGPVRDSFALAWAMGRHEDNRTKAVEWLVRHVPPGTHVAFEIELMWFRPSLDRLPFRVEFPVRIEDLSWYTQRHVEWAVVGDSNALLRRHPAVVAVFPRPPYLPTPRAGAEFLPVSDSPVIDPPVIIVKLGPP